MHASIEQLISCRDGDGDGDAATAAHVAGCPACAAELARLVALRASLTALPLERPAGDAWPALRARLRRRRRLALIARSAAVAALLVTALALPRLLGRPAALPATGDELAELIARSAELETTLRSLPVEDRVMSGFEAAEVAELEDRLAVVDAALAAQPATAAFATVNLWYERVGLLDALVDVRATRASYAAL